MTKFYITTPIYYSNDTPHMGHTGTTIYADIIARHNRLLGNEVFFLTGVDEHGEKVAEAARKMNKSPQEFVDDLSVEWQAYWRKLNISNDHFFRTTSLEHKKIVSRLLTILWEEGKIYKDTYKGIYCVGCEEFKSERDLVDGKCPEHRPDQIKYQVETNYFFKLSEYLPQICSMIENGKLKVTPENKRKDMLAKITDWLKDEKKDISISRQSVDWQIPIPWDSAQTTYVWIEALMNYFTATEIWDKKEYWPANVHFLGKGNNWFHSVIWPALLLALKLPLPLEIYVHGYYNVEGQKMGKSLGNVISPQELIDRYGVDGTRYLLSASMPYKEDSDVSFQWFNERYNSDLANSLGNLVARLSKLAEGLSLDIKITENYQELMNNHKELITFYNQYRLNEATVYLRNLLSELNEYLNEKEPWKLTGDEKKHVIKESIVKLIQIAAMLEPIMPDTSNKIKNILLAKNITKGEALFNKIVTVPNSLK
jgi:methionyl-tRNA synthetase